MLLIKKMSFLVLLFLVLFFSSCSNETNEIKQNSTNLNQQSNLEENQISIVAFGDSLTEGLGVSREDSYPKQLEKTLKENGYNVIVHNSGISGETSTAANKRKEWVMQLNPQIVILVIGANDGFRGIDTNIIKNNIEDIINFFKEKNIKVILGGLPMSENLGEKYINEFENIFIEISQDNEIYFIENFLEGVVANKDLNQEDRIHPTKEGYTYIVQNNVYEIVERAILDLEK